MRSQTTAVVIGFLSTLSVAAPLLNISATTGDWTTQEWDAIVVGAGPAGIIVADRLSEAGKKTLLLEDGGKSYGIVGGTDRPEWLSGTNLSRVDVPGLCKLFWKNRSKSGRHADWKQTRASLRMAET